MACSLVILSVIEAISIEVLFMRGIQSGIRGTMMSAFNFFGQAGTLMFTLVGGQLFDRIDKSAPFVFMALMDSFLVLLTITLLALGKFRPPNPAVQAVSRKSSLSSISH